MSAPIAAPPVILNDARDALSFLRTRRSHPAKTLTEEGPSRAELSLLLDAAFRAPDHGKLAPWRAIVVEGGARARIGALAEARGAALGLDADKVEKAARGFAQGALFVAVIASPKPSDKIPEAEQLLSAGCVCYGLLNAALAAGWGANWLTGFTATDRPFLEGAFDLAPQEHVVGYIHIGAPGMTAFDRPRPDLDDVVRWMGD